MARAVRTDFKSNASLDPWSHLRVWLACGGAVLLVDGLAQDPDWVERVYVPYAGLATSWLTWLTSPFPFAVVEVLILLVVVWLGVRFLEAFAEVGAGRRHPGNALFAGALKVTDLSIFLLAWFVLCWGGAYHRPSAAERFVLAPPKSVSEAAAVERLTLTAIRLTDATNVAYRRLHGTDDTGTVTVPRRELDVSATIERGYEVIADRWSLGRRFKAPRGRVKVPLTSTVLSMLGVSGVYVPFTGEALVNGGPPAWSQLSTMAHEKAHQRMVASEDEATFVGLLAMLASDEPVLSYAAVQTMRRLVQRELVRRDPDGLKAVEGRLKPGPQRDVIAISEYWDDFDGWLQDAHRDANDAYLRLNDVEEGVASYDRAVDLVLAWLETSDGKAALSRRAATAP